MEKQKTFAVDLNTKEGTIDYMLTQKNPEIEAAYNNPAINCTQLKQMINDLVLAINGKPMEKQPAGTKRFLLALNKIKTKDQVIMFVWNARMSGSNLSVIK